MENTITGSWSPSDSPEDAFGTDDSGDETIEDGSGGDGRTLRRSRNRDAVITALLELIREGDLDPTVAKIADRAGVSHRSIFRYFDDLDDLARTAFETEIINVRPLMTLRHLGEGPLEKRLDDFITSLIRTHQHTQGVGRVARSRMISIPAVDRMLLLVTSNRRQQIRDHFAPELAAMPPARSEAIVTAITLLIGSESYDVQRRALESSIDDVANVWRTSLMALLT